METKSTFSLTTLENDGISLNELRTLAEQNVLLKELDHPICKRQQYKKVEKYYKKIEKIKAKLAKLIGITL